MWMTSPATFILRTNIPWAYNFTVAHDSVVHMLLAFFTPMTSLLHVTSSLGATLPRLVIIRFSPWMIFAACCMIMHTCWLHPIPILVQISRDLRSDLADMRPASLSLCPVDIRHIAAMNLVAGECTSLAQRDRLRTIAASPNIAATPADPDDLMVHSTANLLEMLQLRMIT